MAGRPRMVHRTFFMSRNFAYGHAKIWKKTLKTILKTFIFIAFCRAMVYSASAVLRLHAVCPSVCDVGESGR